MHWKICNDLAISNPTHFARPTPAGPDATRRRAGAMVAAAVALAVALLALIFNL